ncbi:sugar ABC transporter substrate-binding protein [Nakamurella multipartita]|uniref:Extracellular solute-binding protein family 1 n=1 Tax=Nakamurella multipartita (strain ATCC 700099 / DSM 44233 / CIP 104796 / JCM 9543 / NBRC 105858 / Y-104) TaxID=479431 RepID=C8X764_NAKMY|nr:sugar ABC transporter substrate-binding protein [Nakamurella multipartita]ACV76933.1 extracellular solute-binding protein family 1 [Nakamurella multipartita DSM 44233]
MFRKKAITAGLLAGLVVLSACGRSSDTAGAAGTSAPAASISAGPATGKLTMWAQGAEGQDLPALLDEFEAANPGVTVDVTAIPWDAAHNKYQTAIAGGQTPDIAQMGTTWMGDFADAFDPTPAELTDAGFFPGSVNSTEVDGTAVGVPWYVDTRVVFYRKDLAEKAGYTTFPTNYDDFKAMAKALQDKAGAQWGIQLLAGGTDSFQSTLPFGWSAGASLMDSGNDAWTLDSPQWVDALTYYQSFFTEGIANPAPNMGAGAAESAFVDGSAPMMISGPYEIGNLEKAGGADFTDKYAVATLPKDKSATSFVGGSNLVVFKDSPNRDAAWKLVQWLSQPEVQVKWYQATGDLPSVQSAWQEGVLADDPMLSVFGDQLKDTNSPPAVPTWTQVSAAADSQVEQIVKAGKDPAQALQELQSQAASIGIGR